MKLLQVTQELHVNLANATMVWLEDYAIGFYILGDTTLDDRAIPLPGIWIEIHIDSRGQNDIVVWVQPDHPKFKAIYDWLTANSF